jgi:hypothetical protein
VPSTSVKPLTDVEGEGFVLVVDDEGDVGDPQERLPSSDNLSLDCLS